MMLLSSSKHEPTAGNSQKEFQSIQESNGRYAETWDMSLLWETRKKNFSPFKRVTVST